MEDLTHYYYEQAGQQAGPVAASQLLAHGVTANTLVWQEGMAEWVSAATLPALAALFQLLPPPLPSRVVSAVPPPIPASAAYPSSTPASAPLPTPQGVPSALPPPATGQPVASTQGPHASPAQPTAHPQFSVEHSTRKWWHYVLYAIAFIFMWFLIRACGAIVEHAITATGQALPAQAITTSKLLGNWAAG